MDVIIIILLWGKLVPGSLIVPDLVINVLVFANIANMAVDVKNH